MPRHTQTFTSSSTWLCPAGVTSVELEGWGGGGGGGSSAPAGNGGGTSGNGGGGGGGSHLYRKTVAVTPGTTYNVNIGAGGVAGVNGVNNGFGGDGGDTTFGIVGPFLAYFIGAMGGGSATGSPSGSTMCQQGGAPMRQITGSDAIFKSNRGNLTQWGRWPVPGMGGAGINNPNIGINGSVGESSLQGFGGGNGGLLGGAGVQPGGGGGGGGGGGPAGVGGGGGDGGLGGNTIGNAGFVGGSAAANTGAGGGGGGAGGGGSSTPGGFRNGGAGGSGQLTIIWYT